MTSEALTAPPPYRIGERESVYLDLIRALAAFAVVLDHAVTLFDLPAVPRLGHQAVIVFFVLSGYVISNTADRRERSASAFLVARFARLWSVLVPALVLTAACDFAGRNYGLHPSAYAGTPGDVPMIRLAAALLFVSETWVSITTLSNGVLWSLCVEFWYYIVFAALCFAPVRRRWPLATLALAMGGQKAILLAPIWFMGVGLQRVAPLRRIGPATSLALFAAGLAAAVEIIALDAYDPAIALMRRLAGPWLFTQLSTARVFWLDWILGLAVAAHLLGARGIAGRVPIDAFAPPIRWCASVSFAAYLFHMPLLHVCAAFLTRDDGWIALALTCAVIATAGRQVERSKGWWRARLTRVAERLRAPQPALP